MAGSARILRTAGAALFAGLLLAACTSAKANEQSAKAATSEAPGQAVSGGTHVNVQLGEKDVSHMFMKVDRASVPAGPVTFDVTNVGVKTHEFVVLETDTSAGEFSIVKFEGEKDRINEDADGTNVGETGDMDAGTTQALTIDLKPGHYALVCNLAGHYRMGMFSDFQVT